MKSHLFLLAAVTAAFVGTAGSGAGRAADLAAPVLRVASLSTVLSDVAQNVGGDRAVVVPIVKSGVDPHEFEPSPSDIKAVTGADLVLVSGKGLEGYLAKLEDAAGGAGKFINVGDRAGASLKLVDGGKTIEDPHWWHSIERVRRATGVIRDAFAAAHPADKGVFAAQAAAYLKRLDALEREVKAKVAELPRTQRKLVTSHDAFQYFARDYGFTIYPIEGVSSAEEPSSRKVSDLLQTIKSQGVKAVFFENIENPKVIAEITRETGAKVGGELYADGLGDKPEASTYEAMMRHNVATIVNALK